AGRRSGLADGPGRPLPEGARRPLLAGVEEPVGALAVGRARVRWRLEGRGELLSAEAAEDELLSAEIRGRLARHAGRERERDRQAADEGPRGGRGGVAGRGRGAAGRGRPAAGRG